MKNGLSSDFYQRVYALVRLIPKGRVTSYGAIAEALSVSGAARTVGYALNRVHGNIWEVPAHRVVNRNGILTGRHHFATPTLMAELLILEGVRVEDDRVVEFEKLFWHPKHDLLSP